jgi:hypothetical protein
LPGCWDSVSKTGWTVERSRGIGPAGRCCTGLSGSRRVTRHVLPSKEADSRAPAAPSYACPGLERNRA